MKTDSLIGRRAKKGEPLSFLYNLPDTDDCIEWPFYVGPNGAGRLGWEGESTNAARVSLILHKGPPPEGRNHAAHGPCHNKACINPRHLSWKTHRENMKDKVRDGTTNRGSRHYRSKLIATEVLYIRSSPRTQKELAEVFRVDQSTISDIRTGRNWYWLADNGTEDKQRKGGRS